MMMTKTQDRFLKLEQIEASDLQPRKHFAPEGIAELVTSFREHGFDDGLSRLLVRPLNEVRLEHGDGSVHWFVQARSAEHRTPNAERLTSNGENDWETVATAESVEEAEAKAAGALRFELVCGERRWRAAGELGLKEVPVAVREMDDLEVLEKQLVENLDREDLTPMEEAMAYKRLIEMGQTQEQIASSLGQKRSHVKARLALCPLFGSPIAEAMERGEITHSHGFELAGVPSAALRLELLEKVLHPPDGSTGPWHVKVLRAHIDLNYQVALKLAKFDRTDADLVPVEIVDGERRWGGACTDCPFNVGREMCTNPECFQMKEIASHEKWRVAVTTRRPDVSTLPHAENAALWDESGSALAHHSEYVELGDVPSGDELRAKLPEGAVVQHWRKLVKGQSVPVVLGLDASGMVHDLARHAEAKKAAHLNGHMIFRDSEREDRLDKQRSATADPAAPRSEEDVAREAVRKVESRRGEVDRRNAEVVAIVKAASGCVRRGMLQLPKQFWGVLALGLLDAVDSAGELDELAARQGFELDAASVEKLSLGGRLGLVVDCLLQLSDGREQWAKLFGVNLKKVGR